MPKSTKLSANSSIAHVRMAVASAACTKTSLIVGNVASDSASVMKLSIVVVVGPLLLRSVDLVWK